jgi:hypothetical protein
MITFIALVLFSWLFGYFANGLYSYKFDLQSCWGGLTAVITGIGSILTIAGVNLVHKYIDSKYNSELGQMPKDAGGERKMLKVDDGNITLTRGDTAVIDLDIKVNGRPYDFNQSDKIIFSMKESYDDQSYIMQRQLTNHLLTFSHTDTNSLEAGTYVYDVQLSFADGQVVTYGPYKLKLVNDVTRD